MGPDIAPKAREFAEKARYRPAFRCFMPDEVLFM
tara:strand:+ start:98092 stop:98193 length:102 start_codon:yes stop_codon:yes gene_type:complete